MTRFIVRVDDVGQALDQSKPDVGLEYFLSWWKAGGWGEHPIYLGVVPAALGPIELDVLRSVVRDSEARICLHGWDHAERVLTRVDIERAREVFGFANCVIPPYNRYDLPAYEGVIHPAEKPVLFGGFDGTDHSFGPAPRVVNGWLHLSADERLYARCYQLVEPVGKIEDPGYPLQVVLHLRWDAERLHAVGNLCAALADRMVAVDAAWPDTNEPPQTKELAG